MRGYLLSTTSLYALLWRYGLTQETVAASVAASLLAIR